MKRTDPDEATKETVRVRALGCCERCGRGDGPFAIHHRRARGMGSTRRPETNYPSNLVLLCDYDSASCHRQVESERYEARRDGWLVSQNADPALTPVAVHGRGWVYLTGIGTYVPIEGDAA